jgi:phosphoenolpyruvate-protein phosphotransferase
MSDSSPTPNALAPGSVFAGVAVSPGVVVATAFRLDVTAWEDTGGELDPSDIQRELARFGDACDLAARELTELIEKASSELGPDEARIFQSHLFMLRDRAFVQKVNSAIADGQRRAEEALQLTIAEYEQIFSAINDEYLRERIVDLRDVGHRIAGHLGYTRSPETLPPDKPVILVAREILPSQTLTFGSLKIAGIVTERGSRTSHAAIIARSLGLPAVSGIPEILAHVRTGDTVVVDGREGHVIVNPGAEAKGAYLKLEREFVNLKDRLIDNRDLPAVTRDNVPVELLANINNVSDAKAASQVGAVGIGLFRTEYLYMTHPSIPNEEEQFAAYQQIVQASPGEGVTIRTLDIGGDKTIPYFSAGREANPFMGWRSIRVSLAYPDFFRRQVRAILRAADHGRVRLLLPMVSNIDEIDQAFALIDQAEEELLREGTPFGHRVARGVMIEIPAAALCIDTIVPKVDFISIGTNDLVQYLMAADRDNPKVAYLCDPLNPAVLRLLRQVIDVAHEHQVPVTVCGEMAGRPRAVLALLSFGLRSFSMSPAFVPLVKELVRQTSLADRRDLADRITSTNSPAAVHELLRSVLADIAPNLAQLDVGP